MKVRFDEDDYRLEFDTGLIKFLVLRQKDRIVIMPVTEISTDCIIDVDERVKVTRQVNNPQIIAFEL